MAKTYKVENTGSRPAAIRARGGIHTIRANDSAVLEFRDELSKEEIAAYKERGVNLTAGSGEAANKGRLLGGSIADRERDRVQAAENPAETGGVVPQSEVSERGGVDRKPRDTTTTTKSTEQQVGAKA